MRKIFLGCCASSDDPNSKQYRYNRIDRKPLSSLAYLGTYHEDGSEKVIFTAEGEPDSSRGKG